MHNTRLISLLLCFFTLLTFIPLSVFAEEKETVIIAASDFQPKAGNAAGYAAASSILSVIKADGIISADAFLCCGDYDYDTYGVLDSTNDGVAHLKSALKGMVDEDDMILAQGNHDASPSVATVLSPSGANDPESGEFGAFVIHNEDYMWGNTDEERIKMTAQRLINYLNKKLDDGFDRPIFVVSHLPLHYSMRTRNDGDGKYARYILDALNEAGEKGLNIIFMYGHDHSNGWDDYLGGAAVYLQKGDNILVADFSSSKYSYETLYFTYLNAGFLGYYENNNGADDTLTMTVFKIKGDNVTVARYDEKGKHDLKSAGVKNSYKSESGYEPNPAVYASTQTITLTKVSDASPLESIFDIPSGGMRFDIITDASQLKDGERYLLVCASASNRLMLPSSVTKANDSGSKRIGFDLGNASIFIDGSIYGEYDSALWSFTAKNGRWLIGNGDEYAMLTSTSDYKITATFEKIGSPFSIDGSGAFTFNSGNYTLNYNARELINGYESNPATFYIFEYVGYALKISGGSAPLTARPDETVTIKASSPAEGMEFDKWVVIEGDIELTDPTSEEITLIMPRGDIKLEATYKEVPPPTEPESKPELEPESSPEESSSELTAQPPTHDPKTDYTGIVIVICVAVCLIAGGAAFIFIFIKKSKK